MSVHDDEWEDPPQYMNESDWDDDLRKFQQRPEYTTVHQESHYHGYGPWMLLFFFLFGVLAGIILQANTR